MVCGPHPGPWPRCGVPGRAGGLFSGSHRWASLWREAGQWAWARTALPSDFLFKHRPSGLEDGGLAFRQGFKVPRGHGGRPWEEPRGLNEKSYKGPGRPTLQQKDQQPSTLMGFPSPAHLPAWTMVIAKPLFDTPGGGKKGLPVRGASGPSGWEKLREMRSMLGLRGGAPVTGGKGM